MQLPKPNAEHLFLKGGGEMGNLTRSYNWANSPLGTPDTWPQSLRTTLNIILNSRFPMFLFWGPENLCFYNDAYRPSLGSNGKHPEALGKPGALVWPEIWDFIGSLIKQVHAGSGANWFEDHLLSIYRNGRMEDTYWTFSYSPVSDEGGAVSGVFVTCSETTEKVINAARLLESEHRFRNLVMQAPIPIASFIGPDNIAEVANDSYLEIVGKNREAFIGKPLLESLPDLHPSLLQSAEEVTRDGKPHQIKEVNVRVNRDGKEENKYFNFSWEPHHLPDGSINGFLAIGNEITQEVLLRRDIENSQQTLLNLFNESPVAIATLSMDDELVFESANNFYGELVGRKPALIIGKPLLEALPELKGQGFEILLKKVVETGVPYIGDEVAAEVMRNERMETIYVSLAYQPRINDSGQTIGILVVATDITPQIVARRVVEASEARLRTLVQSAPAAIGMLLGADLIIESANRTFIELVGCGPDIEGKSLKELIPPKQGILTIMARVFETGEPYIGYGEKLQILREGQRLDRYFNVSISPIQNEVGEIYAIIDVSIDITAQVIAQQQLEESAAQIRSLVESAPFPIGVYTGLEMKILLANKAIIEAWGKGPDVIGRSYKEVLPELANQEIFDQLDEVYNTGIAFHSVTKQVELEHNGKLKPFYFTYNFTPLFDKDGAVYGVMNTAADVTILETARLRAEQAEAKLRGIIASAPAGIGLFVGRDLVIENPNQTFIEIVGKGPNIEGLKLSEAMPELLTEGQPFLKILDEVFTTGKPFVAQGALVKIVQNGILNDNYYNISYTPVYDATGEVYAILDIAIDVTQQIRAQQQLQESELFSRNIIENSPVAKLVFTGPDMVINIVNQNMLTILDRTESIIGMPFMDAIPRLKPTPLLERLRKVYTTGETYYQPEESFVIIKDGIHATGYYNYIFKALRNTAGEIYGVMATAVEITKNVLARQTIEAAETGLRGAIELAQLGTWSIDAKDRKFTCSERLIQWLGINNDVTNTFYDIPISGDEEKKRIEHAVTWALNPASHGEFNEVFSIANAITGRRRILQANGKTTFDVDGNALRINGSAQDITTQREQQHALETEVQLRTEELASTNEELQATNEELAATNEELAEANNSLIYSNEELAQYAYVASHDLQEPLRKIRVFTGLLSNRTELSTADQDLVGKISGAAARMSLLISDLLEFSRLLKSETLMRPIDLNTVLSAVIDDFELVIQERSAVIEIDDLPVIEAVGLQMNQLFYNLLSNALKFMQKDRQPSIKVTSKSITAMEATNFFTKPFPFSGYYDICFTDNGIGFETKYAEQIFEVFKRLHGRDHYPGSGIGLALCRRIAANHSGYLYADSAPGNGTTFHIILPAKQDNNSWQMPGDYKIQP